MNQVTMMRHHLASAKSLRVLTSLVKSNTCVPARQFTTSHSWQNSVKPVMPVSDDDSLFEYTNKRWLFNEKSQLASRYVRFNLDGLVQVAQEAAGPRAVYVDLLMLTKGNYNRIFLAYMNDGKRLVVKIPQPNAGRERFTIASEVATMKYAREKLGIPAPNVLSYCTNSQNRKTGTEYIVMEKAPGIELNRVLKELKPRHRDTILEQMTKINIKFAKTRFPAYGALDRREDLASMNCESVPVKKYYAIGPTVARELSDNGRAAVDVARGPWSTPLSVLQAIAHREISCIERCTSFSKTTQRGIFNGPRGYIPTKSAKFSILRDFLKVAPHLFIRNELCHAALLWHNNLRRENIFVDETDPSRIASVIDWHGAPIYPMFMHTNHPYFDGSAYCEYIEKAAPDFYDIFERTETPLGTMVSLIGSIFDDSETDMKDFLSGLTQEDTWKWRMSDYENPNPNIPCPVKYSKEELAEHEAQYSKWSRDIERRERVLREIGVGEGWDGAVAPDAYDEMAKKLAIAKENFLTSEAKNEEERKIWEKVWPFQDDD
ncbi:kinase-like domain-containing protein [Aspergillus venezuelensis]